MDGSPAAPTAAAALTVLREHVIPGAVDALWLALIADAGVDSALIDADGTLLWCTPCPCWWPKTLPVEEAVGRNILDLPPPESGRRVMGIIQRVLGTGRTAIMRQTWQGVWTQTTFRSLPVAEGRPGLVLLVCRGLRLPDFEGHPLHSATDLLETVWNDHGPLKDLTVRELQVLSLIGQGLTTEQISRRMFRSRKTIEAHRQSLGAKLNVRTRVDLARIAVQCGLHLVPPGNMPTGPAENGDEADGPV